MRHYSARWLAALFSAAAVIAFAAKPAPKPKPPPLTPDQRAAQSILKSLSLRDRVAQLVIGVVYADPVTSTSTEFVRWQHWVRDLRIGGLIVNNTVQNGQVRSAEPYAMAVLLNRMRREQEADRLYSQARKILSSSLRTG